MTDSTRRLLSRLLAVAAVLVCLPGVGFAQAFVSSSTAAAPFSPGTIDTPSDLSWDSSTAPTLDTASLDVSECDELEATFQASVGDSSDVARFYAATCPTEATEYSPTNCAPVDALNQLADNGTTAFEKGRGQLRLVSRVAPTGGDTAKLSVVCTEAASLESGVCTLATPQNCRNRVPPLAIFAPPDWQVWRLDPLDNSDRFDTVNDWVETVVGASCTQSMLTSGFPFLRITTSGVDNDSCTYTHTGPNGAGGFIHQLTRDFYMEFIFRLKEAANDANTVDELDFFVGIVISGEVDPLVGVADFLGIYKEDETTDPTNNFRFVFGNNGTALDSGGEDHATGYTSTGAGIGDGQVEANRAAKLIGPGNWTKIQIYGYELAPIVGLGGPGKFRVWINDIEIAGSPFVTTAEVMDSFDLTPIISIRNGEAAARQLDIARWVVARKMSTLDGAFSRYTTD